MQTAPEQYPTTTQKPSHSNSNYCVVIIRDRGKDPVLDEMWKGLRSLANAYLFRLRNVKNKRRKSQHHPAPSIPQPVQTVAPIRPQPSVVPPPATASIPAPRPNTTWSKVASSPPHTPMKPALQVIPPLDYSAHQDPLLPPIKSRPVAPRPLDADHHPKRPSHEGASKVHNVVEGTPKSIQRPKPKSISGPQPAGISALPCNKEPRLAKQTACAACSRYKSCTLWFHSRNRSYKCDGKEGLCNWCWDHVVEVSEKGAPKNNFVKFTWIKS